MHVENGGLIVITMTMRGGASGLMEYIIKCFDGRSLLYLKDNPSPGYMEMEK